MANDFVQTMMDARVDARSLSDFMFYPASEMITRRLAPSIHTLNYYLDYFNGLEALYSQESGTVTVNGVEIKTVRQAMNDAIDDVLLGEYQEGIRSDLNAQKLDTGITATAKFGGVERTQAEKNAEIVSIEDFYETSWSQALADALLSPASVVRIPENKEYILESEVSVTVNDTTLKGAGLLKAASATGLLIKMVGDNNHVSVNIDGESKIANAIRLVGDGCSVKNCNIKNLYAGGDNSAIAIYIVSDGGFTVSGNKIENLLSMPDGTGGNGIGMSRGIAISRPSGTASARGVITYNTITDCFGEEGDAITVHSTNYGLGNVEVSHNTINNWTRRGIKVQAFAVDIFNNTLTNIKRTGVTYSLSGTISMIEAGSCKVVDNTITDFEANSINLNLTSIDPNIQAKYKDIDILRNTVSKPSADTSGHLYVSTTAFENLNVNQNLMQGGAGISFTIDGKPGYKVANNTFLLDDSTEPVIRVGLDFIGTFTCSSNTLAKGNRQSFLNMFNCPSSKVVLTGNIINNDTPLYFVDKSKTTLNILSGNTAKIIFGGSLARVNTYLHQNHNSDATDKSLAILYCDIVPSSNTRMGGLYVSKGTLVKNTTGGEPHFWLAKSDGLANAITWDELYLPTKAEILKLRALS